MQPDEITNQERGKRFAQLITLHQAMLPLEDREIQDNLYAMASLLADAMHWCDSNGLSFNVGLEIARDFYAQEL